MKFFFIQLFAILQLFFYTFGIYFLCFQPTLLINISPLLSAQRQSRIIGGSDAMRSHYTFQASIRDLLNFHLCGGWIHSSRWIGSAAHCTAGRTILDTRVIVGTVQRNPILEGVVVVPSNIINHPQYNGTTYANDISLIKTLLPISFTAYITSIPLNRNVIGPDVQVILAGWGRTYVRNLL